MVGMVKTLAKHSNWQVVNLHMFFQELKNQMKKEPLIHMLHLKWRQFMEPIKKQAKKSFILILINLMKIKCLLLLIRVIIWNTSMKWKEVSQLLYLNHRYGLMLIQNQWELNTYWRLLIMFLSFQIKDLVKTKLKSTMMI